MKPEKLNSLLALAIPIATSIVTAFAPQIQEWLSKNAWIAPVFTAAIALWNNISQPVHK